jgi:site-specific recombinase XerD
MMVTKENLPEVALKFLKAHPSKKRRSVLRSFHRWMTHWKIDMKHLKPTHIESFIRCPNGRDLSSDTQEHYRRHLVTYLLWLYNNGLLCFAPWRFSKKRLPPLPQPADRYIRTLAPTRRSHTVDTHRAAIRCFHRWLDHHKVCLSALKRHHLSAWLELLNNVGYAPSTHRQHIIIVRLYLWWLYEQKIISSRPDDLIRQSDMVRMPKYLPRPLSPAADKALQKRLAHSDCIYAMGLLLMRKTGLRIGELSALEVNCLRTDFCGNHFLKVPLGKLHTERLVPLDHSTVCLIEKLQGEDPNTTNRTFLIETPLGKKTSYRHYIPVLNEASKGIETNGKMVSHRLRHTYATSLLSAGMSLVSIMRLLGHRDFAMTLRYADITQETVVKEYFEAVSQLEYRYADVLNTFDVTSKETDPLKSLEDAIRLIQKMSADHLTSKSIARSLIKRIQRIKIELRKLCFDRN